MNNKLFIFFLTYKQDMFHKATEIFMSQNGIKKYNDEYFYDLTNNIYKFTKHADDVRMNQLKRVQNAPVDIKTAVQRKLNFHKTRMNLEEAMTDKLTQQHNKAKLLNQISRQRQDTINDEMKRSMTAAQKIYDTVEKEQQLQATQKKFKDFMNQRQVPLNYEQIYTNKFYNENEQWLKPLLSRAEYKFLTKKQDHLFYGDESIQYFIDNIEIIVQRNVGNIIMIKYVDKDGRYMWKPWIVKSGLIKETIDKIKQGKQPNIITVGSDPETSEHEWQPVKVEVITLEHVKNRTKREQKEIDEAIGHLDEMYQRRLLGDDVAKVQAKKKNHKNAGSYFNYLNTTHFDLSRYQIGRTIEEHKEINNITCFIYALQMSGVYNTEDIENIKDHVSENILMFKQENIQKLKGCIGPLRVHYLSGGVWRIWQNYKIVDDESIEVDETVLDKPTVEIVQYKEHYFLYEIIQATKWYVDHYSEYKDNNDFLSNTMFSQFKGNKFYTDSSKRKTNSAYLIKSFDEQGLFTEIDEEIKQNVKVCKKQREMGLCQPHDVERYFEKQKVSTKESEDWDLVMCADTEGFTKDESGNNITHQCFMFVWTYIYENGVMTDEDKFRMYNSRNVQGMINYLLSKFPKKVNAVKRVLCYFHNLTYDAQFIINQKFNIHSILNADGKILQFKLRVENIEITFRDSLRISNSSLANFTQAMYNTIERSVFYKEIFPYSFYTFQRYIINKGSIEEASKFIREDDKKQFMIAIEKAEAFWHEQCMSDDDDYVLNQYDIKSKYVQGDDERRVQMYDDLKTCECHDRKYFNMKKYALYYCEQDVRLLAGCITRFYKTLLCNTKLNLFDFISISSLSLQYQIQNRCFEGVQKVTGLLRQYYQQFVVGGCCMSRDNKMWHIKGQIYDDDGRALYPSAQRRAWYCVGAAKQMTDIMIKKYNRHDQLFSIGENDGLTSEQIKMIQDERELTDKELDSISACEGLTLFMTVKIIRTKDTRNLHFPLPSNVDDNGVRQFTNECHNTVGERMFQKYNDTIYQTVNEEGIYYLSIIQLQDLVKFQKYDYEILEGNYFTQRNYIIRYVIQHMYDERAKAKATGNSVQQIYKLMLNSSYGKTIEGEHFYEHVLIDMNDKDFIINNWDSIEDIERVNNTQFMLKMIKQVSNQKSYHPEGIIILDMSKRIMNEVKILCEDNDLKIYYQDTDSMQMTKEDYERIKPLYEKAYGRVFEGAKLGQFHNDYESKKGEVVCGTEAYYLEKKIYCVKLLIKNKMVKDLSQKGYHYEPFTQQEAQDENFTVDYHIRMKGCGEEVIKKWCEDRKMTPIQMYKMLYDGEEITFNLTDTRVQMKKQKDGTFINLKDFTRTIKVYQPKACEDE